MSPGVTIAISIIGFSILLLIIVGAISYSQMKPTLESFKQLKSTLEQKKLFYQRESQHLTETADKLNQDVGFLQEELDIKNINFQSFTQKQNELQNSLLYLKNHAGEYSKGIARNFKNEVKEEGPKIFDVFKRSFKKTAQKQKTRFINRKES